MTTTNQRNGTESTTAVAAFRNLQISIMAWRGQNTLRDEAARHIFLQNVSGHLINAFNAIPGIHLVDFLLQLLTETLREATHHIQFADFILLTQFRIFQNRVDGFLLGIADEATSVNHHHI